MAGSLRNFKYTTNTGLEFALNLDESNTLLANAGLTASDINPTSDLLVLPVARGCRKVTYRSSDALYTIVAVALTPGALASAPGSITLNIAPSAPGVSATTVVLTRGRDRAERFSRAKASDTGQTT